jgi:hypothetical protein
VDPLEIAMILDKVGDSVHRDERTGLYIIDGTVPPTELTLSQYESAKKVLAMKGKREV